MKMYDRIYGHKTIKLFDYYFRPPIRFFKKYLLCFLHYSLKAKDLRFIERKKVFFTKKKYSPDDLFSLTAYKGLKSAADESLRCIVIGSDQVWNDRWIDKKELACRLGSFVFRSNLLLVMLQASAFLRLIRPRYLFFKKYLPRLKAISVREDRGMALVGEMTGLNAAVVLDPTLMLTSNKWIEIFEGFVPDDDEYVLTYFLGRPSDEQGSVTSSICEGAWMSCVVFLICVTKRPMLPVRRILWNCFLRHNTCSQIHITHAVSRYCSIRSSRCSTVLA